jgi:S1-C subfamily serine protease
MPTVSIGKVSGAGQPETMADGTDLIDTIEASMPLSPGSWGTVLLDRSGEVIGILDSEEQSGGVSTGVFVPASLAVAVADALAGGRDLVHGWLGIVCADPHSSTGPTGPVVASLFADGPASMAGIEPGDVIRAVDGLPVTSVAQLQARLYTATPGTTVLLTTFRDSAERDVPVTLSSEPG